MFKTLSLNKLKLDIIKYEWDMVQPPEYIGPRIPRLQRML